MRPDATDADYLHYHRVATNLRRGTALLRADGTRVRASKVEILATAISWQYTGYTLRSSEFPPPFYYERMSSLTTPEGRDHEKQFKANWQFQNHKAYAILVFQENGKVCEIREAITVCDFLGTDGIRVNVNDTVSQYGNADYYDNGGSFDLRLRVLQE